MVFFISCYSFWLKVYFIRYKYSWLSVSVGDWFQDPTWIPKSVDAQVPYIKCNRTLQTVGPPHPQISNHRLKILFSLTHESFFSCCFQNSAFDFWCLHVDLFGLICLGIFEVHFPGWLYLSPDLGHFQPLYLSFLSSSLSLFSWDFHNANVVLLHGIL